MNEEFGQAIGADAYCRDAAVPFLKPAKTMFPPKKEKMPVLWRHNYAHKFRFIKMKVGIIYVAADGNFIK
ncbi:MAG: hypothetical protein Ct9H300mP28_35310 [Pseudomonadota bacterium]|nr:MAG: hypothetical protein Ct9H300mP28_35310 [Pseudomonadota bacterium]